MNIITVGGVIWFGNVTSTPQGFQKIASYQSRNFEQLCGWFCTDPHVDWTLCCAGCVGCFIPWPCLVPPYTDTAYVPSRFDYDSSPIVEGPHEQLCCCLLLQCSRWWVNCVVHCPRMLYLLMTGEALIEWGVLLPNSLRCRLPTK